MNFLTSGVAIVVSFLSLLYVVQSTESGKNKFQYVLIFLLTAITTTSILIVINRRTFPVEDETALDQRIAEIQTSLNQVNIIAQEVQELGQQAIEAEQRASDAIAISQLTEDQVRALEKRLNRDQTMRDILFVLIGGLVGVLFERLANLIGWLINNRFLSSRSTQNQGD